MNPVPIIKEIMAHAVWGVVLLSSFETDNFLDRIHTARYKSMARHYSIRVSVKTRLSLSTLQIIRDDVGQL